MSKIEKAVKCFIFSLDILLTKSFYDETLNLSYKQLFICFSNHLARLYSGVLIADNTGLIE